MIVDFMKSTCPPKALEVFLAGLVHATGRLKMLLKKLSSFKRRFLKPPVLRKIVVQGTMKPRTKIEKETPVFRISCAEPELALDKADGIWSDYLSETFLPSHQVLIKINLNTADPYPASTSPEMLRALIDFLLRKGIRNIKVGDCSAVGAVPTSRVAKKGKLLDFLAGRAEFVPFDPGPWVRIPIDGKYLKEVIVPRIALEADRVICLANQKTHREASFSFGLKLAVGFMHPLQRYAMHRDHLEEKAVEINLAVPADLTIIDGRKAFVTGGPDRGKTARGDIVIFGTNPLAVDAEAYRQLYSLKQDHACVGNFKEDPFEMTQLCHGREMGLGGTSWKGYTCIEL